MATATRPPQQQPRRLGDFNRGTRQSWLLQPIQAYPGAAGQTTRLTLPQTGYGAGIQLLLQGTTTTAAASSTTVATYPVLPYSFLRRIRIYNNQGVELINMTGYGAYLYSRTLRTYYDPAVLSNTQPVAQLGTARPSFRFFAAPSSLGASATEVWKASWYIPIVWGFSLQHGLQLWQDPAITYTVEITWGDATDLYSSTTGTVTLSGVTVTPMVELYHVPPAGYDLPDLAFTKTVLEEVQPLTSGTGDNTYSFVTGNVATRIIQELTNGATVAPIQPTTAAAADQITQVKLFYSQTQVPYIWDASSLQAHQRLLYSGDLPGGVFVHELSDAMGLPELVTTRDALNTARLTDMKLIYTLSGVTLNNGNLRTIKEQLVANR
jgi:hypothetical protein